jgi:serine protease SohB
VVPVVRLTGAIGVSAPLRPGLTLASCARALDRAFSYRRPAAVALVINSPGGSAAQSHLIFTRIRRLAEEKKVPVIAFVEDVAASGGYMIACAADEIVADQNSIVGSIGVVGGSFGFHGLLEKIGVERRLYTSGERKAMLDPFLPEKPEDVARLKAIQQEIHDSFIAWSRRAAAWRWPKATATCSRASIGPASAASLGLVDRLGDLRTRAARAFRRRRADPADLGPAQPAGPQPARGRRRLWDDWTGRPTFAEEMLSALEARALWARFGL